MPADKKVLDQKTCSCPKEAEALCPLFKKQKLNRGTLTEGEGSVNTVDLLIQVAYFLK
jgi:hypothetical protein